MEFDIVDYELNEYFKYLERKEQEDQYEQYDDYDYDYNYDDQSN